jgi:phosphoadenosine phosphosulfate reductase
MQAPPAVATARLDETVDDLATRYAECDVTDLLRGITAHEFPGQVAVVSSFGAESALLLALIAEVDQAVPVVFLDTEKHFAETLAYRDSLVRRLGLRDVRSVRPDVAVLRAHDPDGLLWQRDADRCCALRKVLPLERALTPFAAWFTGRKRYQTRERRALPLFEAVGGRIKINPLAAWSAVRVADALARRGLPLHPLEQAGYRSIGCLPCTAPVGNGGQARDGRWSGQGKTECGIHAGPHGIERHAALIPEP